jgi:hypothetical protein
VDKRLQKRHKRQVARAKEHVSVSEPDLRTPEQIKAAKEASRPAGGSTTGPNMSNSALSFRGSPARAPGSASKTDA